MTSARKASMSAIMATADRPKDCTSMAAALNLAAEILEGGLDAGPNCRQLVAKGQAFGPQIRRPLQQRNLGAVGSGLSNQMMDERPQQRAAALRANGRYRLIPCCRQRWIGNAGQGSRKLAESNTILVIIEQDSLLRNRLAALNKHQPAFL
ncbi:MAG TPA: hypothetical protein VHV26_03765 [Rhizomicrobium sp.]|jgi:hypothetical protein|nr:hypothetical protein [Rhizomicrobium sp.]